MKENAGRNYGEDSFFLELLGILISLALGLSPFNDLAKLCCVRILCSVDIRSNRSKVFLKIGFLKNFSIFSVIFYDGVLF